MIIWLCTTVRMKSYKYDPFRTVYIMSFKCALVEKDRLVSKLRWGWRNQMQCAEIKWKGMKRYSACKMVYIIRDMAPFFSSQVRHSRQNSPFSHDHASWIILKFGELRPMSLNQGITSSKMTIPAGLVRHWMQTRVVLDSDCSDWLDSDLCDNPGDSTLTQLNTLLSLIDSYPTQLKSQIY